MYHDAATIAKMDAAQLVQVAQSQRLTASELAEELRALMRMQQSYLSRRARRQQYAVGTPTNERLAHFLPVLALVAAQLEAAPAQRTLPAPAMISLSLEVSPVSVTTSTHDPALIAPAER